MRIEIHERKKRVALITFDINGKKFKSDYERNKFFRGLHGWKQIINKGKRYSYHRQGILDEVPHVKIADSVFMVAMQNLKKIMKYFEEWSDKVHYEILEMIMNEQKWNEMLNERRKAKRIKIESR